jgi:hypothetical protein
MTTALQLMFDVIDKGVCVNGTKMIAAGLAMIALASSNMLRRKNTRTSIRKLGASNES